LSKFAGSFLFLAFKRNLLSFCNFRTPFYLNLFAFPSLPSIPSSFRFSVLFCFFFFCTRTSRSRPFRGQRFFDVVRSLLFFPRLQGPPPHPPPEDVAFFSVATAMEPQILWPWSISQRRSATTFSSLLDKAVSDSFFFPHFRVLRPRIDSFTAASPDSHYLSFPYHPSDVHSPSYVGSFFRPPFGFYSA